MKTGIQESTQGKNILKDLSEEKDKRFWADEETGHHFSETFKKLGEKIKNWGKNNSKETQPDLPTYLGMTQSIYDFWVRDQDACEKLLAKWVRNQKINQKIGRWLERLRNTEPDEICEDGVLASLRAKNPGLNQEPRLSILGILVESSNCPFETLLKELEKEDTLKNTERILGIAGLERFLEPEWSENLDRNNTLTPKEIAGILGIKYRSKIWDQKLPIDIDHQTRINSVNL